jgi:hypothetical protein
MTAVISRIRRLRWPAVLAAVFTVIFVAGCESDAPTAGMNRDEVVDAYIQALQKGDKGHLVKLNNPGLDRTEGIDRKIATIGNRRWMNVQITWFDNPVTGERTAAKINATDEQGRQIRDAVTVSSVDGFWYVDLGGSSPHPEDPRLNSPSPAST